MAGRDFVASCYELFLGRDVDALMVVEERGSWSVDEVLSSFLACKEFEEVVYAPLRSGTPFSETLFCTPLLARHRFLVLDRLPILLDTRRRVQDVLSWRDLLASLARDPRLMALSHLPPLQDVLLEDLQETAAMAEATFDPRMHAYVLRETSTFWA